MSDMIIDFKGLELHKWLQKQPRRYRRVTAQMLTEFAVGTRFAVLRLMDKRMIIRNRKFVSGHVIYTKATMSGQRSLIGTTAAKRFSGWVEQEVGEQTKRTRVATLKARGGSKGRQILGRNRLKPGNAVVKAASVGLGGREANFIEMMKRTKEKRLIMIRGAIVRLFRKVLKKIQHIKPPHLQPRKRPFLVTSRGMYFKTLDMNALWRKVLARIKE